MISRKNGNERENKKQHSEPTAIWDLGNKQPAVLADEAPTAPHRIELKGQLRRGRNFFFKNDY
jgi:hypothetical protein